MDGFVLGSGSLAERLQTVLARGVLGPEAPAAMFVDLEALGLRIRSLLAAFPEARHAIAVKTLPLPPVLRLALDYGLGLEVASEGELGLAEAVGAPPSRVVFDSPAKTRREIGLALGRGVRMNLDNLQEVERVAQMNGSCRSAGLRINPCVDGASIAATFTAGSTAKFGVPLASDRPRIIEAFERHPFLDGLHVHVGSQGCDVCVLVEGVGRVAELAMELRDRGIAVRVVNIGGGLPVGYRASDQAPSFAGYAEALTARAPMLFDGSVQLTTEFGRALVGPVAWVASRVEYTRSGATARTAVIHVGADMFVRTAYRPEDWFHEIEVYDAEGRPKPGPLETWSVAGPLCFSSDYLAVARELPRIEPDDILVVRDAGAYTLGMWSRYNSRPMPPVYGYGRGDRLNVLKPRETVDDVVRFWCAPESNIDDLFMPDARAVRSER